MRVVKCPEGHGYDADRYSECPVCKKSVAGTKTKIIKVMAVKKAQPVEVKAEPVKESNEINSETIKNPEKLSEVNQEIRTETAENPEKTAEVKQKIGKMIIKETELGTVRFHEPVVMLEIKREIRHLPIKEPPVESPDKPTKIEELGPEQKNLIPESPIQKPTESEITIEELCDDKNIESDMSAVIDSANNMATDKSGRLLIKYIGKNEIIHIPNEITTIGKYAFSTNKYVKKIIMSDSVEIIDKFAFSFCDNLESVVFSGNLESIGENAFYHCSALRELNFPNSLKIIGKGAFGKCSSLTILNFPAQLKRISDFSFCECASLSRINISKSVETIGTAAFSKCHRLVRLSMADSVQTIGDNAFSWCSALESVVIPPSVKTIGSFAFFGCNKLSDLKISINLKDVRDEAFSSCDRIESVSIAELEGSNFNANYVKKAHRLTLRILKQISQRKAERYANEHKLSKIFI